jgi:hypothetical protein
MALASDLDNQEFMGARNPDSGLHAEFYWHEPVDAWASREKSMEAQRNVVVKLPKQPFCRVMVPGVKETIWEEAVKEHHKQRFPRQWLAWQISEGLVGGVEDIPGWKLGEWDELTEDQVRELLYMRFQTVEQLAGANDRQIQGIGMGGILLREKARVALRNKMGSEVKAELDKKDAENAELRARLDRLEKAMLGTATSATPTAAEPVPETEVVVEKRGPGRPAKQETVNI